MSVAYDWCSHEGCGAPIDRWSSTWMHRDSAKDADHKAEPEKPVEPLDEGLYSRATRYADSLAAASAAQQRIDILTELVSIHEWHRSQAEQALSAIEGDPLFGTIIQPTGDEPEEAAALLCLVTGSVYRRAPMIGGRDGWQRAEANPANALRYEWPIADAGPFIAWRDDYGFDKVLREARRRDQEFDALHRKLYNERGYRSDDAGWGRPVLAEAIERILRAHMERVYEANTKAQAADQQLRALRRAIDYLTPDDTQEWPVSLGDDDGMREVEVIDLRRVRDLLDRADCGGAS